MILIGIPIGLYGYLFPGNINLMMLEIYRSGKTRFLFKMLGLVLVFESIYCVVSLTLLNSIKSNPYLYNAVENVSYVMIFLLGSWMLLEKKKNVKKSYQNTIYRGVLSVIIHPQQIPFWIIAGIIISRITHLSTHDGTLFLFVLFNAIGTCIAMLLYMVVGSKLLNFFRFNISQINKVMGGLYILVVLYHLKPF
jgi:threonine/homoserine/homoserine lactone efflux protein